jgi:DNA-binding response OmpR family regulator
MPKLNRPPELDIGRQTISVLSVSPAESDHTTLERLLPEPQWSVYRANGVLSALALFLQLKPVPVVLCEDFLPGAWRDLLVHTALLPDPPSIIVASRLADDCLWAEALNLGAYDVLAKPFDMAELTRSLHLAWLHSQRPRVVGDTLHQGIKVASA